MKQSKLILLTIIILLVLSVPTAVMAAPLPFVDCTVSIVKLFGGSGNDEFMDIQRTESDFIMVGYANSKATNFAPDIISNWGGAIMKVNASGSVLWGKLIENAGNTNQLYNFSAVEPLSDGYIAVGSMYNLMTADRVALAMRFGLDGTLIWQKTFGSSGNNQFVDICPSGDGNVIAAGIGYHFPRADYGGTQNGLVMKLDASDGSMLWQTSVGGTLASTDATTINAVQPVSGGGYIVSGQTRNNDGDFSGPALSYSQAFTAKLDISGNCLWTKTIGGSDNDAFVSIIELPSGNLMAVGSTRSVDGDFTSATSSSNVPDAIAAVLDSSGALIRYFRISGNSTESFRKVVRTTGGVLAFGATESTTGEFTGISNGYGDALAAKIDETSGFIWITNFGGTEYDQFNAGVSVDGNTIVAVGKTKSANGDLAGVTSFGGEDLLLAAFTVAPTDTTGPSISLVPSTTDPTRNDVVITVTASDPSGVAEITLPDGSKYTSGSSTAYTVSASGTYTFKAKDSKGYETTESITISNIDKVPPSITLGSYDGTTPTKNDITVTATSADGTLNFASHTFSANGFFDFVSTDAAGNVTTQRVTITNIDKTPPEITLGAYESVLPVDGNITVTATTNEGTLNTASHTFTANGSFDFIATDAAGNVTTETVTITNIHKIPKILSVTGTQKTLAAGTIQLTLTAQMQWFPAGSPVIFDLLGADKLPLATPVHGTALTGDDGKAILVIDLPDGFIPGSYFMAAGVAESNAYSADNPIVILEPVIPQTGESSSPTYMALALLLAAGLLLVSRKRLDRN